MSQVIEKHPRAIRWFHWINFPLLGLMIWSGILIYWANDVYKIRWGGRTLFHFFPAGFYSAFQIDHRLAEGMAWHFFLMWLFAINGIAYVAYTWVSGEWRELLPTRNSWSDAIHVALYQRRLSKQEPPRKKYNGAQRIVYTAIVLAGAGSLLTGLVLYKPVQVHWLTSALGGYEAARAEHFVLMLAYVGFFIVHVLQVARAGWNNFRSMVAGFEIE